MTTEYETIAEALDRALFSAIATMAFHSLDRGTPRETAILDTLEKIALRDEPRIRAAITAVDQLRATTTAPIPPAFTGKGVEPVTASISNNDTRPIVKAILDKYIAFYKTKKSQSVITGQLVYTQQDVFDKMVGALEMCSSDFADALE